MKQLLTQYEEIAQLLQDGVAVEKLTQMKAQLEEKHYYVPVIGQFSAGKSSLLNNLLGRRFLPTMLSETTAFSTFIYYGESEYAEIVTKSMGVHTFMIEKLMDLSQRNLNSPYAISEILKLSAIENTDIVCLNVYLKNPLLQSGIVFVDTPGLNTIISTHENRTMDLLPRAHSILYVMGKALTAADAKLVSALNDIGVDLFFVRTKLDELRTDENDTPAKIMAADRANIEETLNMPVTYFGVSNEEQYKDMPQWSVLSENLKTYLQKELAEKVEERRLKSIQRRLNPIKQQFATNIEQRLQQVMMSDRISDEDIQKKITSLENEREYVQSRVDKQMSQFKRHFEVVEETILTQFAVEQQQLLKQYEKSLNALTTIDMLQQQNEQLAGTCISEAVTRLSTLTNEELNAFLKTASANTNEALQATNSFSLGEIPNISLTVDVPTIHDVFEKGQFVQNRLEERDYEEEMMCLQQKRQATEQERETIYHHATQAQMELEQLGTYEARYIEQVNDEKQKTMKNLGNMIDWAMVFIPGKVFATGATKLAAGVGKLGKGMKYTKQVTDTITKAGQILNKTDKVKDIMKVTQSAREQQPGALDMLSMLSVEYWFEKVGKMMDGPPKLVEDESHRIEYQRQREDILTKADHAKQMELMRMQKLELINTQEERLREEQRLNEKYRQDAEKQLYEAQRKHEQELEEKKVKAYREQLIAALHSQLNALFANYKQATKEYLQNFITHVPVAISLELQQQLHTQKMQLQELIERRQHSQEEQLKYRQQLEAYKQLLAQ